MTNSAPNNKKSANTATASVRLFLAVPIEDVLASELTASLAASMEALPPLKPVPEANLHLTLLFLGQFPADSIQTTLTPAITEALKHARPGRIHLRQVAGFPRPAEARCLVVEGYPSESAKCLQQQLEEQLRPLLARQGSTSSEHTWRPHITLARFRQPPSEPITGTPWQQDLPLGEVILYRSDAGPDGPRYTEVERWTLN